MRTTARNTVLKRWPLTVCTALLLSALAAIAPTTAASSGPAKLAVYQGNGCTGVNKLPEFVNWLGREPDLILDFFNSWTWKAMQDDAAWTVSCWRRTNRQVVFSVPMLPSTGGTLAEGASGKFDDQFVQMAQVLVKHDYGNAIIRLGWEFNGGWYPWAAKKDPENWVLYWRRIVAAMRSVPGAAFRFNWVSTLGMQQIRPDAVYPGDEYVDIIGQDVYNQTWRPNVNTPEERWQDLLNQSFGLKWLRDFAQAHGKPMSIPEWGTGTRPDGHAGGDDPYFITQMAEFIQQNNVEFHGYWDFAAKDFNARLSAGNLPRSGAAFREHFSRGPLASRDAPASSDVLKGGAR